jgi:hypothetical protein
MIHLSDLNPAGYIPGGEAVSVVAELAKELKDLRAKEGHELIYVLDREPAQPASTRSLLVLTAMLTVAYRLPVPQLSWETMGPSMSPSL